MGSPPMPMAVDCPSPSAVNCPTASYVSVPERETTPTRPSLCMWPGMMPILHLPGEMMPGQFGPMRRVVLSARYSLTLTMSSAGMPSVMQTTKGRPGACRLHDGFGGEGRRDVNHAGVRARLADRVRDGVEDGNVLVDRPAL